MPRGSVSLKSVIFTHARFTCWYFVMFTLHVLVFHHVHTRMLLRVSIWTLTAAALQNPVLWSVETQGIEDVQQIEVPGDVVLPVYASPMFEKMARLRALKEAVNCVHTVQPLPQALCYFTPQELAAIEDPSALFEFTEAVNVSPLC